jgi:hypothetical protein
MRDFKKAIRVEGEFLTTDFTDEHGLFFGRGRVRVFFSFFWLSGRGT